MEQFDYMAVIDRHYPAGKCRDILLHHSRQVADEALGIARRLGLPLSDYEITAAAMVHDIGIVLTDAPGIHCHGAMPYLAHGRIGADLLRAEGAPEWLARIAERHTGSGITAADIRRLDLPLPPDRDYVPETLLERLICYADKFYSKSGTMERKDLDRVRASQERFGPEVAARFESLHKEFAPADQ